MFRYDRRARATDLVSVGFTASRPARPAARHRSRAMAASSPTCRTGATSSPTRTRGRGRRCTSGRWEAVDLARSAWPPVALRTARPEPRRSRPMARSWRSSPRRRTWSRTTATARPTSFAGPRHGRDDPRLGDAERRVRARTEPTAGDLGRRAHGGVPVDCDRPARPIGPGPDAHLAAVATPQTEVYERDVVLADTVLISSLGTGVPAATRACWPRSAATAATSPSRQRPRRWCATIASNTPMCSCATCRRRRDSTPARWRSVAVRSGRPPRPPPRPWSTPAGVP